MKAAVCWLLVLPYLAWGAWTFVRWLLRIDLP